VKQLTNANISLNLSDLAFQVRFLGLHEPAAPATLKKSLDLIQTRVRKGAGDRGCALRDEQRYL